MNDMIKQLNCQLGHVSIDEQGQLTVTSKPFGNLDFDFDYHAPSHIAGNNRPGFMIVPLNKGDVGKKKKKTKSIDTATPQSSVAPTVDLDAVTQRRSNIKAAGEPEKLGTKAALGRDRQK